MEPYNKNLPFIRFANDGKTVLDRLAESGIPLTRALQYFRNNPEGNALEFFKLIGEDIIPFYGNYRNGGSAKDYAKEAMLLAFPTMAKRKGAGFEISKGMDADFNPYPPVPVTRSQVEASLAAHEKVPYIRDEGPMLSRDNTVPGYNEFIERPENNTPAYAYESLKEEIGFIEEMLNEGWVSPNEVPNAQAKLKNLYDMKNLMELNAGFEGIPLEYKEYRKAAEEYRQALNGPYLDDLIEGGTRDNNSSAVQSRDAYDTHIGSFLKNEFPEYGGSYMMPKYKFDNAMEGIVNNLNAIGRGGLAERINNIPMKRLYEKVPHNELGEVFNSNKTVDVKAKELEILHKKYDPEFYEE